MAQLWPHIWVFGTFWAYWGLTRCGPFDKICLSSFWVTFESICIVATKRYNFEKMDHFRSFLHSLIFKEWSEVRNFALCTIQMVYQVILISGKTNLVLKIWYFLMLKRKDWKLIITKPQKLTNFDHYLKTGLFFLQAHLSC